jgi:hypothetical protein
MKLQLKNGHLILPSTLVQAVLESETQVNWVYYPERQALLLAGKSKQFFEKLHKTNWQTLKDKNLLGDKAFYLRGLLIDFELDEHDRELTYNITQVGIINVQL